MDTPKTAWVLSKVSKGFCPSKVCHSKYKAARKKIKIIIPQNNKFPKTFVIPFNLLTARKWNHRNQPVYSKHFNILPTQTETPGCMDYQRNIHVFYVFQGEKGEPSTFAKGSKGEPGSPGLIGLMGPKVR